MQMKRRIDSLALLGFLSVVFFSCSESKFGKQSNREYKPVSILEQKESGANAGSNSQSSMVPEPLPPLVVETPKPIPQSLSAHILIKKTQFALAKAGPVEIEWSLKEDMPDLDVFSISVTGSDDKKILEVEQAPTSLLKDSPEKYSLNFSMEPNTSYVFSVSGYKRDRSYLEPAQGRVVVDTMPPVGRIFLGASASLSPCTLPPAVSRFVASSVIPVQFCFDDQNGQGSGVAQFCLKSNASSVPLELPSLSDDCWKPVDQAPKQVLLTSESEGLNVFHLFLKDAVGNVGRDEPMTVSLTSSEPPKVEILGPSSSELASSIWKAGEVKVLKWKVSDLDTLPLDIRIVVSLLNRSNKEDFVHLACSFADAPNAPLKMCPDPKLALSPGILRSADGSGQYSFKVDPSWDLGKPYMLAVTAIDKAGNAAVLSTAEINQSWEVLAGRSYNGFGGTGSTMQATEIYHLVATDALGQLYNTSNHKDGNYKVRSLDGRTCRFSKKLGAPSTPFDCEDILATNEPILGSPWKYIEYKDVFYAAVSGSILEINFKARSVRKLAGSGAEPLPVGSEVKPLSSLASIPGLKSRLAYEPGSKSSYFVSSGRIYQIDSADKVRFVVGSGKMQVAPSPLVEARAADLDLPNIGYDVFSVTADGRILFTGDRLPNWNTGSGFGLSYVLESVKPGSPDQTARLMVLGGTTGVLDVAASGPSNEVRSTNWSNAQYRPEDSSVYVMALWKGVYRIKLPPVGSPETAYQLEHLSGAGVGTNDFAIVPKTNILFYSEFSFGNIFQVDIASKQQVALVGSNAKIPDSVQSENANLSAPRYFQRLTDNEIYFNDFNGLRKTKFEGGIWTVSTLIQAPSAIYRGAFRLFEAAQKIVQLSGNDFRSANLANPSSTVGEVTRVAGPRQLWYPLQFGHSTSASSPKMFLMNTDFDGVSASGGFMSVVNYDAALSGSLTNSTNLVAAENLDSSICGADKKTLCTQGTTQTDSRGGRYYAVGTYRLPVAGFWYHNRNAQTTAAFSSNDEIVYTCGTGDKFLAIDVPHQRIYEFSARANGTEVSCPFYGSVFHNFEGQIYVSVSGSFYRFSSFSIFDKNSATLEKLDFGKFPASMVLSQFEIVNAGNNKKNLLFTDLQNHRLLRKAVSLP